MAEDGIEVQEDNVAGSILEKKVDSDLVGEDADKKDVAKDDPVNTSKWGEEEGSDAGKQPSRRRNTSRSRSRSRSRSANRRNRSRSPGRRRDMDSPSRRDSPGRAGSPSRYGRRGYDEDRGARERHQEVREGDWACPNCNANCFRSRTSCFRCRTPKPGAAPVSQYGGDWSCPSCHANVFARRNECFKCRTPRPMSGGQNGWNGAPAPYMGTPYGMPYMPQQMPPQGNTRPGDWTCPECRANVFASRNECYKCRTPKPPGAGESQPPYSGHTPYNGGYHVPPMGQGPPNGFRAGDWLCPSPQCSAHNYASRTTCFRCNGPRGPPAPMGGGGYPPQQFAPYGGNQYQRRPPAERPGDWKCSCGANCFASRDRCFKCNAPKPNFSVLT
mmetsp:Transcript_17621/g.28515  ORF Transcript_17621/g.28515 Transcript_17621/m.28515 type:complete len:386 (+) Transcript_17621:214-1371(+)